jgi:hypothetical protein
LPNPREIVQSLRLFGYDGPVLALLVRHKAIVRTSSGKLARSRTREEWRSGRIAVLESHFDTGVTEQVREIGLKARYERILSHTRSAEAIHLSKPVSLLAVSNYCWL